MREIIKEYKCKVRKIIKNFTGTYNEDIEQEVYIKTWKNLSKYNEQNKFKQWICALTSNVCRDYLKSKAHRADNNTIYDSETLNNIRDNKQENLTDSKERQKNILKEINRLPSKLKQIIIYYELEEKGYEEISAILNIPVGTVKSRLHNAREILREKLKYLI